VIDKLDDIKKQLAELANVLNAFKSEAVQLRILEFVLGEETTEGSDAKATKPPNYKKTPKRIRQTATKHSDEKSPAKRKKLLTGSGAPATLTQLVAGTFFDKPRTINDIIEHCRHNLARSFKANEFSGKLARLVRSSILTRKKNADKQYEYKKP